MNVPPAFCTGSMITIATVSGPSNSIVSATSSAHCSVQSAPSAQYLQR